MLEGFYIILQVANYFLAWLHLLPLRFLRDKPASLKDIAMRLFRVCDNRALF
jgi:hypothetical protein